MVLELTKGIGGLVGAGGAIADVCQMSTVVCLVRHLVAGAAMGCHRLATFWDDCWMHRVVRSCRFLLWRCLDACSTFTLMWGVCDAG